MSFKHKVFLFLIVSQFLMISKGEGPIFKHKEPEKQQEFENAYKDIRSKRVSTNSSGVTCIDSPTLCVDEINNLVGVGTTSPASTFTSLGQITAQIDRNNTQGYGGFMLSSTQKYSWRVNTDNDLVLDSFNGANWISSATMSNTGVMTFTGQLIGHGTNTNDSAAEGYIGQSTSSYASFTSTRSAQFFDAAYIRVSPGDWDISTVLQYRLGTIAISKANLTVQSLIATASGQGTTGNIIGDNYLINGISSVTFQATEGIGMTVPSWRTSLTANTTYYLKAYFDGFSAGAVNVTGRISARRVR